MGGPITYGLIWFLSSYVGGTQPNVICRWGVHVTYCLGGEGGAMIAI